MIKYIDKLKEEKILVIGVLLVLVLITMLSCRSERVVERVVIKTPEEVALSINAEIVERTLDRSRCPDGFKITTDGKRYSFIFESGMTVGYKFRTKEGAIAGAWRMWDVGHDRTHWEIVE